MNIGHYCHKYEDICTILKEENKLFSKILNDSCAITEFTQLLSNNKNFLDAVKNIVGTELFQQFKGNITNPVLYDKMSEHQKYQINSLIASHSLKYKPLIKKLLKHISYKDYFFIQGMTNLNFHFENCNDSVIFNDQKRNHLNDNKEIRIPLLAKFSRYMTVMFYNHEYWDSPIPPTTQESEFLIKLNSLLEKNQRNYISQINNANENELTLEQKNFRTQLNNPDVQKKINDLVDDSYLIKFDNIDISSYQQAQNPFKIKIENNGNDGKKIIVNINKPQFAHIMNSDENNLNKCEKDFKYDFLDKVATVNNLEKIEFPANSEITIYNLIEKNPQLEFLNHLNNPIPIPSQIKVDSKNPVENVTVDSAEKLSDFENIKREIEEIENQDVTNILFKFEEKTEGKWPNFTTLGNGFLKEVSEGKLNNYFKPSISNFKNYFQIKQQKESILLSAINVKISLYPPKKQIEIICKFMSSQSLKPEFKLAILREYSQTQSKNFIQALAVGKIELNLETAQYFLKAMFELYKTNANMATLFKTQLLNNPNTTAQFRAYLNTMDFMALIPTFSTLYASYASTVALINTNLTIASVAASCYYASMPTAAFALILNQQNNQQLLNRANNQPLVETR